MQTETIRFTKWFSDAKRLCNTGFCSTNLQGHYSPTVWIFNRKKMDFTLYFSIRVDFHSLECTGHTLPVNVTDSVKFLRHCERDWCNLHQRSRPIILLPLLCAPVTAAFQHSPGRDSPKHWGLHVALISIVSPGKRFTAAVRSTMCAFPATPKKWVAKRFKGRGKPFKSAIRVSVSIQYTKPLRKFPAHFSGEAIQAKPLDDVRTVSRCPLLFSLRSDSWRLDMTSHKPPQLLRRLKQRFCLSANSFFNSEQSKWRTNCLMSLQEITEKVVLGKIVLFVLFTYTITHSVCFKPLWTPQIEPIPGSE